MMTLWVHSWPWYPAEGCFSVEEVAAGSTPVTVAIINYDNKGLLSICHHMITITNNAVVAQLARAPSWSLGGRWFDASRRRWNPHIRDTEKPWFIARSIALMDAYMDAMTRGLKSWWLAGNRCTSETAATWTWMMAFRKASMGTMRTN